MKIIEDKPVDLTFEEFCQGGKSITPGPWVVAEEAKIKHSEGTFIAQARYWPDAYLIAAAPELLETLSTLLAMCDRQVDFNDDGDGLALERARAAIAKAEEKNT